MKLDTKIKIVIVAMISAVITSAFLPNIDHPTVLEGMSVVSSYIIMAVVGFAIGLGRDIDGNKIVEKDFDPEA